MIVQKVQNDEVQAGTQLPRYTANTYRVHRATVLHVGGNMTRTYRGRVSAGRAPAQRKACGEPWGTGAPAYGDRRSAWGDQEGRRRKSVSIIVTKTSGVTLAKRLRNAAKLCEICVIRA